MLGCAKNGSCIRCEVRQPNESSVRDQLDRNSIGVLDEVLVEREGTLVSCRR